MTAPAPEPAKVALVVVSHSEALARAAAELAHAMTPGGAIHIGIAAGADAGTRLGTDAAAVARALRRAAAASRGAGVLVLSDLGSAVMSAELGRELVGAAVEADVETDAQADVETDPAAHDEARQGEDARAPVPVRLSAAPLVEGLVVAAVMASVGADLDAVDAEACGALTPKANALRR